jgi:D-3-phosphoglycerate dehydrogenase / 2-oxoglutarate reductase
MTDNVKILVSDPLSDEGLKILTDSGIPVDVKPGLNEEELCAIIGDYDGLIIRSGTTVTKKVIDSAKKLRVIGRAGVGVDNIDVPAATDRGILVMNTPSANIVSAAEHSCAMIMALCRRIPFAHESVHKGEWKRSKFTGVELNGKVLGIIGVGRVGGEVAKRLKAFNMTMVGYDPFLPKDVADSIGVKLTTLEEVITTADIMTIHTPLLPDTRNMISLPQFKMMKPSAYLVNVARGGIVNEDDLYTALKEKIIAGAAFDVWCNEPLSDDEKKLLELDNLVTTPHLGASTVEAQERVAVEIAEYVVKYLNDGTIANAINAPRGRLDPELEPFVPLVDRLGIFVHQINGSKPINQIEITYCGEISEKNTKLLTISAVAGILKNIVGGENANLVNAMSIAKGKGINVVESKREDSPVYNSMIELKVTSGKEARSVRGTVFSNIPRLVGIDEYGFEIPFNEDMFYVRYKDTPGMIGAIGSIMGAHGINIGQMTVGRDGPAGTAIMVMSVDQVVTAGIVEEVRKASGFQDARFVDLVD